MLKDKFNVSVFFEIVRIDNNSYKRINLYLNAKFTEYCDQVMACSMHGRLLRNVIVCFEILKILIMVLLVKMACKLTAGFGLITQYTTPNEQIQYFSR
jgi:hypothetical protein